VCATAAKVKSCCKQRSECCFKPGGRRGRCKRWESNLNVCTDMTSTHTWTLNLTISHAELEPLGYLFVAGLGLSCDKHVKGHSICSSNHRYVQYQLIGLQGADLALSQLPGCWLLSRHQCPIKKTVLSWDSYASHKSNADQLQWHSFVQLDLN